MNEFERAARHRPAISSANSGTFCGQSKKWWLLPILVLFLLFGVLMLLSSTAAAPFIYTLF